VLKPSSASGGTGVYLCASPTTCTVGGLPAGTAISGCTLSYILQKILVPTVPPAVTPPSHSAFIVSPSTAVYEVGTSISLCVTSCFDRGCISPQYCGACCFRSGLPTSYCYTDFGVPTGITSSACCNCHVLTPHAVTNGNNLVSGSVSFASGATPAYDSTGGTFCTTLPAGTTTPARTCTICGLYPYFYGSSVGAPVVGQALINSGTKVVFDTNNDIAVNFNVSGTTKYLWLAVPSGSTLTIKHKWVGSNAPSTNTEPIPGGLFNAPTTCVINEPTSLWVTYPYRFYVSNYATNTYSSGFYSLTFKNS
jgi:hypothetical protein